MTDIYCITKYYITSLACIYFVLLIGLLYINYKIMYKGKDVCLCVCVCNSETELLITELQLYQCLYYILFYK